MSLFKLMTPRLGQVQKVKNTFTGYSVLSTLMKHLQFSKKLQQLKRKKMLIKMLNQMIKSWNQMKKSKGMKTAMKYV